MVEFRFSVEFEFCSRCKQINVNKLLRAIGRLKVKLLHRQNRELIDSFVTANFYENYMFKNGISRLVCKYLLIEDTL